jgi:hypothetical protein
MDLDDVGDLNNWVGISCRKATFGCGTLDIKAHNSQGCNIGLDVERYWLNILEVNYIKL